jgi:hypothetical protein
MAEGFTECKNPLQCFFLLFFACDILWVLQKSKSKRNQGIFLNGTPYTTGQAFCFLKCPETIGGKNTLGKVAI